MERSTGIQLDEADLQRSSERVVAEDRYSSLADYAVYRFHAATYEWAATFAKDRYVVDYGCGTGYGASILAPVARRVDAFDTSAEAIAYATGHHAARNVGFQTIDGSLPVGDQSVDLLVSFQVIEHVDPDPYLTEVARVLAPDGVALFATPNRNGRLFRWQKPWNRWHLTEYVPDSFRSLLDGHLPRVELFELMAEPDLLAVHQARWRRARLVSAPLTLPFIPEAIRQRGLAALSALSSRTKQSTIPDPGGEVWVEPMRGAGSDILAIARR